MSEHDHENGNQDDDLDDLDDLEVYRFDRARERERNIIDCNAPRRQWTLRALRRELRMTQAEVAEGMGTNQTFVSRLEAASHPSLLSVLHYGKALGGEVRLHLRMPNGGWRELDVYQWVARERAMIDGR